MVILLLVVVNGVIICLYRRYLQNEMERDLKMQVQSAVSQYVALSQIPELNQERVEGAEK
jgi:hypothetical protein